jgi:Peptidase family M23
MGREQSADLAGLREAIRAASAYRPDPDQTPVVLTLPFHGTWLALNTPARRVPSHGTHFLGQTFAIDFVAVDGRRRTSAVRDWRSVLAPEPPDRFYSLDRPILAPASGRIVAVHDGEPEHPARRSPLTVVPYLLTQASRLRQGLTAVTGNYMILALDVDGPYVAMVHLRPGSMRVGIGEAVTVGQPLATCGNSGNSTQPHLHIQVMDSPELLNARGVPMVFRNYRASKRGEDRPRDVPQGIPGHREVVEAA